MKLALLNTSILTAYGEYAYRPCSLAVAREDATAAKAAGGLESYIGHQSTADILSQLLGMPVLMNRDPYTQGVEERALVFKLRGRAPEGVILSREEVEAIGYDLGFLVRVA